MLTIIKSQPRKLKRLSERSLISEHIKENFAIFFNNEGPTHLVFYRNEKPIRWKHFTAKDKQEIFDTFYSDQGKEIANRQIFNHPLIDYLFIKGTRIGYGLRYPAHVGPIHTDKETIEQAQWPEIVIEYPNLNVYYKIDENSYGRLILPNVYNGSLCTGNTYFDLSITDYELAWKHVQRQFFGAMWSHYSDIDPTFKKYLGPKQFEL